MTTTKPPVLTDEDIDALRIKAFQTNSADDRNAYFEATSRYFQDRHYGAMDREQAVLERAGADAVRDAALEEAIKVVESVTWSVGNSAAGELAAEWTGRSMSEARDAIRALKGTPAAAVADSMPGWSHWETRIKALMQDMGMPNSHSAYQALAQLANEMGQAHAASVAGQLSGNPGQVADAQPVAWINGHSLKRVSQARSIERVWLRNTKSDEDDTPLYAAPQAGQLSGNAGEVDAARLDWLAAEGCAVESLTLGNGTKYALYWPATDDRQIDWHPTWRAAIDAAIAASKGANHG